MRAFAAATITPVYYLPGDLVNISADSVAALDAGHIAKVKQAMQWFGEGLEEVLQLMVDAAEVDRDLSDIGDRVGPPGELPARPDGRLRHQAGRRWDAAADGRRGDRLDPAAGGAAARRARRGRLPRPPWPHPRPATSAPGRPPKAPPPPSPHLSPSLGRDLRRHPPAAQRPLDPRHCDELPRPGSWQANGRRPVPGPGHPGAARRATHPRCRSSPPTWPARWSATWTGTSRHRRWDELMVDLRRDVSEAEVYHRPFVQTWWRLPGGAAGVGGHRRLGAGRQIAEMDLQQTYAHAVRTAMREVAARYAPTSWRRLLTGTGACELCRQAPPASTTWTNSTPSTRTATAQSSRAGAESPRPCPTR